MRIGIYTSKSRMVEFKVLFVENRALSKHDVECVFYRDYDDFIGRLPRDYCDFVVVAQNGAEGMESARASKVLCPSIPLVWFSEDGGFVAESYKIGCSYFSSRDVNEREINNAVAHCVPHLIKKPS